MDLDELPYSTRCANCGHTLGHHTYEDSNVECLAWFDDGGCCECKGFVAPPSTSERIVSVTATIALVFISSFTSVTLLLWLIRIAF